MYDVSTDDSIKEDENLTFTLKYDTTTSRLYVAKNNDIVVDNSMWVSDSVSNASIYQAYQAYKDKLKELRPCQYHLDIVGEIFSRKQFLPSIFKNIALKMYHFKGESQDEKESLQDLAEYLYKTAEMLETIILDQDMNNSIEIGKLKKLIKGMKSKDRLNLDIFKVLGQTEE